MSAFVTSVMACASAFSNSSRGRAFAARKQVLIFDQHCSMGECVGRVGRQPKHARAAPGSHLLDLARLVDVEIVEHHHVAAAQARREHPREVSVEG